MRTLLRLCLVVTMVGASTLAPAAAAHAADAPRVLVITAGNDDAVIADYAFDRLDMEARRWRFELVEGEPADLADLSDIDVVMFLNTLGDILDADQETALEDFVEGGGGLVGTHSAAATEPGWAWWNEMIGATATEPRPTMVSKQSLNFTSDSPITDGLDEDLELKERWYYFDPGPTDEAVSILAHLDSEEPVAWSSEDHKVFYSVAGGEHDTWGERDFLQLIRQAIWWAADDPRELVQYTGDAAPEWPYTLTFIMFIIAVAGGGSIAVWRLDETELDEAESEPDTS